MNKFAIKAGYWGEYTSKKKVPEGELLLNKLIEEQLASYGYPLYDSCCFDPPSNEDIGKVLSIGTHGITLTSINLEGGGITSITLGEITDTIIPVIVVGGTNFNIPSATSTKAGLITAALYNKLNSLKNIQYYFNSIEVGVPNQFGNINFSGNLVNVSGSGNNLNVDISYSPPSISFQLGATTANSVQLVLNVGTTSEIITLGSTTNNTAGLMSVADRNLLLALNTALTTKVNTVTGLLNGTTSSNFDVNESNIGSNKTVTLNLKNFTGAATGVDGKEGLVPKPLSTEKESFLKGDGTWATPTFGNPILTYSCGSGCTVTASGEGIEFNRINNATWEFIIPEGVFLFSHRIYSTANQNPGMGVSITYNYINNHVVNQGVSTAYPPQLQGWNMQTGVFTQSVSGGTAGTAFRPYILNVSGGSITMQITVGTAFGTGETMIAGYF